MRIDKFLWCIRAFKTRGLATEACRKDRIRLNDQIIKPSADVKLDDIVSIRKPPIWRTYQVEAIPKSRVAAKLLPELITETTSEEDLDKLEIAQRVQASSTFHGKGRPTKKQRRDMNRLDDE